MADATAVGAHLRRLDGAECAAFVADLWAARGFDTRREGRLVTATRDGTERRLYCPARFGVGGAPDGPVDAVVAPGGGADAPAARTLDAGDLREMLRYGVDAADAAEICSRHFGAPPDELGLPLGTRVRRSAARSGWLATPALLAVGLAVLVVAGGAGVGPAGGPDAGGDGVATASGRFPIAPAGTTPERTATPGGAASLPPGITADGVANLSALAAAHSRALGDSYTVWVDRYRGRDARRRQRDVDIAVDGDRYLIDVAVGDDDNRTPVRTVYHDGRGRYAAEHVDGGVRYRRLDGAGTSGARPAPDPARFRRAVVERFLSTPTTAVTRGVRWNENDRTLVRVVGTGRPAALDGVGNYSVVALVDRTGVVYDLTAEYTVTGRNRTVEVTVEVTYGHLGETRVAAPPWYRRNFPANATATPAG